MTNDDGPDDPVVRRAWGLLGRAWELPPERLDEQLGLYDEVVGMLADSDLLRGRELHAAALHDKARALQWSGRLEEALAQYDRFLEAEDRLAAESGLLMSATNAIMQALEGKARAFAELGRGDEELAAYEQAAARYDALAAATGDPDHLIGRSMAASAMARRVLWFDDRDRSDRALAAYRTLVTRFGDDLYVRSSLNVAGVCLAQGLADRGQHHEAVTVCDDLASRDDRDPDRFELDQVASALFTKAAALAAIGRDGEVQAVYDDIARRCRDLLEDEDAPDDGLSPDDVQALLDKAIRHRDAPGHCDDPLS